MAQVTIQNTATAHIDVLGTLLAPGQQKTIEVNPEDVKRIGALQVGGYCTFAVVYSQSELAGRNTYSNAARPPAAHYSPGFVIWNTDDNAPNWSDGANWRDSNGIIT